MLSWMGLGIFTISLWILLTAKLENVGFKRWNTIGNVSWLICLVNDASATDYSLICAGPVMHAMMKDDQGSADI